MYSIIIVEDDLNIQNQIKELLVELSIQKDKEFNILYYEGFNQSLKDEIMNHNIIKIYILDIELENSISGIEIAEKIREEDWDSEIIFITSHDNMFESVYRTVYNVFDFIEKFQNMDTRLKADIKKILNMKLDKKILKIENRHITLEIYLKNIQYISRDKEERKIIIHADNDVEYKVSKSLQEVLELLDGRFVQTHKSCIANKDRMCERNYAKGYFKLDTGQKIDLLSKKYKKGIEKWLKT